MFIINYIFEIFTNQFNFLTVKIKEKYNKFKINPYLYINCVSAFESRSKNIYNQQPINRIILFCMGKKGLNEKLFSSLPDKT